MPSSAARPPNEAPYPTLVGTAMTGTATSPPTTLGQRALHPGDDDDDARAGASCSPAASSRWMPATPTSISRSTLSPNASATDAASSATGRSLVPADTTRIGPALGGGASCGGSNTVRASAIPAHAREPRPQRGRRRLGRAGAEKRPVAASSRSQIATTCSSGLPLAEDHLGLPLPQGAMVVDAGERKIFERKVAQALERRTRRQRARRRRRRGGPRAARVSRHCGDRLEILEEDRLGLRDRLDLEEPLAEVARAVQTLGVPAEVLAELDDGLPGVALEPERQPGVLRAPPGIARRRRVRRSRAGPRAAPARRGRATDSRRRRGRS